jgi:FAD/FMN-containing dehydrogenase
MPNVASVLKEEIRRLARKEAKILTGPLKKALADARGALPFAVYTPSGTESVDLAIRLARVTTGRPEVVSAVGAYHGLSGFALAASDRIVLRFTRSEWMRRALELHRLAVKSIDTERHVIVLGYGRNGQHLARLLDAEGIRYVALDLDPDRVREAAFRPWDAQAIPRRFCSGVARISDGRKHVVHYSILETSVWLGVSWGFEWCVVGLDRNWAYNPSCRMARP